MRLTVLGGYLGSGKTTWLRHQLFAGSLGRVHVLVNEAAETPVDHALLGGAVALTVLAGGCACCDGRAGLVAALRDICDARSRGGATAPDGLILETSGLADPAAIVEAIRADPVLVHHVVVAETVVVVDAVHALATLGTDALGRRQIEAADRLIVTKTDLADRARLARLVATLGLLNPGAAITGSAQGVFTDLPAAGTPETLAVVGPNEPMIAVRLRIDPAIDWPALTLWLSALIHARGDALVRIKGVVSTPAGRLLIQSVRRVVQSPELLPDPMAAEDDTLVFIGRGFREAALAPSLARFAKR